MAWRDSPESRSTGRASPNGLPAIEGFTVEAPLDEGGFSQVYRAVQETPERPVAIKVFRTSGKLASRVRERFKRESDVIGQLSSEEGLVTVFTGGFTDAGAPYLAMELCEGGSIADRIRAHGPLPVAEVLAVGQRVGSALAIVHAQGVSHRDVKPSNILRKADGRALLTDFGLSVIGEMSEAFGEESRMAMTEVYAPPERLNPSDEDGAGVDAAGDQYSFALTLYAMLLGGSPFTGETTTQRALRAFQGQIEPLSRTDVPPSVLEVLHRAMSREPGDRFQSMSDMVTALASAGHQSAHATPAATGPAFGGGPAAPSPWSPTPPGPVGPGPGLSDQLAEAPTSMPGAGAGAGTASAWYRAATDPGQGSASQPIPQRTPGAAVSSGPSMAPVVAPELAEDATRMPKRDPGIPVIEAPPAPEPKANPKRNLYIGAAVAASMVLVLIIGALVLRGGSDPEPSQEATAADGEEASGGEVGAALVPPTVDKVRLTDDGLAFTWDGDTSTGDVYPLYQVRVDGAELEISQPIDRDASGAFLREQFVNSVDMDDGTVEQIDADQHEYCIVVRLIPSDPDGPDQVESEPECL